MNYEQKYQEALEKVKGLLKDQEIALHAREKLANVFPELIEYEDEKIRKEIIDYINRLTASPNNIDKYNTWLAWLEKQGDQTTDKVGPKFKVGDYVAQYNSIPLEIWKVINIDEDGYYILQHITCPVGDEIRIPAFTLEKDYYKADGMFWRCF